MPDDESAKRQEELQRRERADRLDELVRQRARQRQQGQEQKHEKERLEFLERIGRQERLAVKQREKASLAWVARREADSDRTPHPFLDEFQSAFERAIKGIDEDAGQLVEAGRDYQAIRLACDHWEVIQELWSSLSTIYIHFQRMRFILEHFDSERLRQFGQELPSICHSFENYEEDRKKVEARVLEQFEYMQIPLKSHWLVRPVVITEFYFMLDILSLLLEPDFVPLEHDESSDESPERYIPANVKRAVWRRDGGKCVQCGSRDKLEYDHIIPVSKGGSNTERNIQLLCEKCNRTKATQIR